MSKRMLRDWTDSEKIDTLSAEAERFFTRLIMKVDDHGCFHANPKLLKSALFPLKEITDEEIISWLESCKEIELLIIYTYNLKRYLKINDFGQRLRTMKSKFPQPNASDLQTNVSELRPEVEEEEETEEEDENEVEAIVCHLNLITGSSFKSKSEKTKKHINARIAEKFALDDFKAVINYKFKEWGQDQKMREFLRPETLFGTKFESYLQAAKKPTIILNGTGSKQNTYNSNKADVAELVTATLGKYQQDNGNNNAGSDQSGVLQLGDDSNKKT